MTQPRRLKPPPQVLKNYGRSERRARIRISRFSIALSVSSVPDSPFKFQAIDVLAQKRWNLARPSHVSTDEAELADPRLPLDEVASATNRGTRYEDIRAVSDYGSTNGQVFGVAPDYDRIRTVPVSPGRWFNDEDNSEHRRVAVVGWELLKNTFPGRPAVGNSILLNGINFAVIGVIQKIGKEGNNGTNGRIFVPIETMRMLFPLKAQNAENAISFINYRPLTKEQHLAAKREMHEILGHRHGFDTKTEDAFQDWDTIEESIRVGKIFNAMDWFLGVVGIVTLALGAIGIINIMLVSVTERTKEIGLRKALGATYRNILTQFFVEGAFLTAFSGGIGLAISVAFVTLLAQLPAPEGFDTPRIVPSSAVAAILSLAVAGIVAGLYPARKAALLPPVEALRQE